MAAKLFLLINPLPTTDRRDGRTAQPTSLPRGAKCAAACLARITSLALPDSVERRAEQTVKTSHCRSGDRAQLLVWPVFITLYYFIC